MISDVLYDTIDLLDYYQGQYAATYSGYHGRISDLKAQMRQLAQDLDAPPDEAHIRARDALFANGDVTPATPGRKQGARKGLNLLLWFMLFLAFAAFVACLVMVLRNPNL